MLDWFKKNKDAITVILAIASVIVSSIVWLVNHQYNQYIRINILEQQLISIEKDFTSYQRTLLLTELIKIEQEIENLRSQDNLTDSQNSQLLDLLVRQEVLTREISEISGP